MKSLLVWTTTPWTLTSNVAAAVGPELTYVRVHQGDEYLLPVQGYPTHAPRSLSSTGRAERHGYGRLDL